MEGRELCPSTPGDVICPWCCVQIKHRKSMVISRKKFSILLAIGVYSHPYAVKYWLFCVLFLGCMIPSFFHMRKRSQTHIVLASSNSKFFRKTKNVPILLKKSERFILDWADDASIQVVPPLWQKSKITLSPMFCIGDFFCRFPAFCQSDKNK